MSVRPTDVRPSDRCPSDRCLSDRWMSKLYASLNPKGKQEGAEGGSDASYYKIYS